jgi:hypothetical protein
VRRKRGLAGSSSRPARISPTTVASVEPETNVAGQRRSWIASFVTTFGRRRRSRSRSSKALGPRWRFSSPRLSWRVPGSRTNSPNLSLISGSDQRLEVLPPSFSGA